MKKFLSPQNNFFLNSAFFITSCFIAFYGYKFNIWDQAENLTPVYKLLDNSLYEGDFYLQYFFEKFNIRYFYVYLVYILAKISSVEFAALFLTLTLIYTCIFIWLKIAFELTQSYLASFIAIVTAFFIFYKFTAGGNFILYNMLSPSQVAKPIASIAIFYFIRKQYLLSAFLLGLAFYFQQLVGFQLFILFSAILIFTFQFKSFIKWMSAFLVLILPLFINILLNLHTFSSCLIDKNILNTINEIRHYRHFLPIYFPVFDILKYLFMWFLGFILLFVDNPFAFRKELKFFYGFQLLGILFYSFTTLYIHDLAVLQFFKTTIWIVPFTSILMSNFLVSRFSFFENFDISNYIKPLWLAGISLWILMSFSKYLPLEKLKSRYQFGFYKPTELMLCHQWISKNTPKDAFFIIPPDNSSFAGEAKRPQLSNVGAFIHTGCYAFYWNESLKKYYGVDLLKEPRDTLFLKYLLKSYPFFHPIDTDLDFRLDDKSMGFPKIENSEVVFESEHYLVRKLK